MRLQKNIKIKNWFWNLIPWINYKTMQAFYPNIYLPPNIYNDLISNRPDPYNVARLIHEQTHIKRIKKEGWLRFALKYALLPMFRFNEEIEANRIAMKFIKSKGLTWNIDNTAKHLSSWLYFWPISYTRVRSELDNIWKDLN